MSTNYRGINYGLHDTNRDNTAGIRYGVISQNEVLQAWADSSEANYGEPTCPECGNTVVEPNIDVTTPDGIIDAEARESYAEYEKFGCNAWACDNCKMLFDSEHVYSDEPHSFYIDDGEYQAECGEDGDIFITKSPYFTYAQFCSPCAPGACYLLNELDAPCEDNKCYCFGNITGTLNSTICYYGNV